MISYGDDLPWFDEQINSIKRELDNLGRTLSIKK